MNTYSMVGTVRWYGSAVTYYECFNNRCLNYNMCVCARVCMRILLSMTISNKIIQRNNKQLRQKTTS